MSWQRQGGQLKHRASTEVKPAHTQVRHSSSIFLSVSPSLSIHLSDSLSLSLLLFDSFSLTQNIQGQLNVTMTAVAITLVSHEPPNSQAQGEDSSDPTAGIGYNYALWV